MLADQLLQGIQFAFPNSSSSGCRTNTSSRSNPRSPPIRQRTSTCTKYTSRFPQFQFLFFMLPPQLAFLCMSSSSSSSCTKYNSVSLQFEFLSCHPPALARDTIHVPSKIEFSMPRDTFRVPPNSEFFIMLHAVHQHLPNEIQFAFLCNSNSF